MFGATTWALKRLLKFVLKRNLKQWIQTELDIEQLDVQLGKGLLELREIVLNVDYINERLALPWVIEKAFVGSVQAYIPFSTLYQDSCSLEFGEVLLTVRPRGDEEESPACCPPPVTESRPPDGSRLGSLSGSDAVSEGIRRISAALEYLLQRLKVKLKTVVIRVLVPRGSDHDLERVVVLTMEQLAYTSNPKQSSAEEIIHHPTRSLSFVGLTASLRIDANGVKPSKPFFMAADGQRGLQGTVVLGMQEKLEHGIMLAELVLDCCGARVQLDGPTLHVLSCLVALVMRQLDRRRAETIGTQPADIEPQTFGSRSLLESLMLPDMEDIVRGALAEGAGQIKDDEDTDDADEFVDASSVFASVYGSVSSESALQQASGSSTSISDPSVCDEESNPGSMSDVRSSSEQTLSQLHELAARIRQNPPRLDWSAAIRVPAFDIALEFPSRCNIVLSLESLLGRAGGSGPDVDVALSIATVEVVRGGAEAGEALAKQWEAWGRLPASFSNCPTYAPKGPLVDTLNELSELQLGSGREGQPGRLRMSHQPVLKCTGGTEAQRRAVRVFVHMHRDRPVEDMIHVSLAEISVWLCTSGMERLQSDLTEILSLALPAANSSASAVLNARPVAPKTMPAIGIQVSEVCTIMPVPVDTRDIGFPTQCLVAHIVLVGALRQERWRVAIDAEMCQRPLKPDLLQNLCLSSCIQLVPEGHGHESFQLRSSVCLESLVLCWMLQEDSSVQKQICSLKPQGSREFTLTCTSRFGFPEHSSSERLEELWATAHATAPESPADDWREEESASPCSHHARLHGGRIEVALTPRTMLPLLRVLEALLELVPQPTSQPDISPESWLDVEFSAHVSLSHDVAVGGERGEEGTATVKGPGCHEFVAEARSVRLRLLNSIGNVAGASAVRLEVTGFVLWTRKGAGTWARAGNNELPLGSMPLVYGSGVASEPEIVVLHITRPLPCAPVLRGKRVIYPSRSRDLLKLRHCTLLTLDGDVQCGWVAEFVALLKRGLAPPPPDLAPEAAGGEPHDISVVAEDLSVRYEPPATSAGPTTAALVLLEHALWTLRCEGQTATLSGIEAHLAPAQTRRRDVWFGPGGAHRLRLRELDLSAETYMLVAKEAQLQLEIPTGSSSERPEHVRLSNKHLRLVVSGRGSQLLQRLGRQVAPDSASGDRPKHSSRPRPTMTQASASGLSSATVLAAVNQNAFGDLEGHSEQRRLSSSVFVPGGGFYEHVLAEPLSPTGSTSVVLSAEEYAYQDSQPLAEQDGDIDGTWLGPTKVMEDYITPPSEMEDAEENGKAAVFKGSFQVEVCLISSKASQLTLTLRDLGITVGEVTPGNETLRTLKLELQTLILQDSLGRPVLYRYRPGSMTSARHALPPQLAVTVLTIPTEDGTPEYRAEVALQPLRLSLRRRSLDAVRVLLNDFDASVVDVDEDFGAPLVEWPTERSDELAAADTAQGGCEFAGLQSIERAERVLGGSGRVHSKMACILDAAFSRLSLVDRDDFAPAWPFIQSFTMHATLLVLDHAASSIDLHELRNGSLIELLHLVPIGGVRLSFGELHLTGIAGLPALAAAVGTIYMRETTRQAHKIVGATGPVKPFVKVAGSASSALSGPLSSFTSAKSRRYAWELTRSVRKMGWAVLNEAISTATTAGTTATAATSSQAQMALIDSLEEARMAFDGGDTDT